MEVCLAHCHGHLNLNIFCISKNWILPVQALGVPKRPWHLRTLMSPLINFFLESQNTGEVNDSSTGGTSCCHFLSGLVFHHFHIRVFPVSLAAIKISSRYYYSLKIYFLNWAKFCVLHLAEKGSLSVLALPNWGGILCWWQASKIGLFCDTLLTSQRAGPSSLRLHTAIPWSPACLRGAAGPPASEMTLPSLIYSVFHLPIHQIPL